MKKKKAEVKISTQKELRKPPKKIICPSCNDSVEFIDKQKEKTCPMCGTIIIVP